jgi:hypothetical protein
MKFQLEEGLVVARWHSTAADLLAVRFRFHSRWGKM